MTRIGRLWDRYVRRRPRTFRLYVRLPTEFPDGRSLLAEAGEIVDDIAVACEGTLDVYGTVDGLVVTATDVPAETFDESAFETCLEAVEALYDDTHALAVVKKWVPSDRRPCRSYVVVPVRPLFPGSALESTASPSGPAPATDR